MALLIKYTSECGCGGKFTSNTLDLTQDPGERVVIDLDLLGGIILECDSCEARVFLPELSGLIEDVE